MRDITEWFAECGWGVFCHWLGAPPSSDGGVELSAEEWNRQVDAFDVKGLADQLAAIGAPYLFITIGQNSGHFLAPNATYDKYVAIQPSKCSRRDLVSDLYNCLHPRGIELLVYLPCGAPAADPVAVERLGWEWWIRGWMAAFVGHAPHRQAAGGVPEKVGGDRTQHGFARLPAKTAPRRSLSPNDDCLTTIALDKRLPLTPLVWHGTLPLFNRHSQRRHHSIGASVALAPGSRD